MFSIKLQGNEGHTDVRSFVSKFFALNLSGSTTKNECFPPSNQAVLFNIYALIVNNYRYFRAIMLFFLFFILIIYNIYFLFL